MSERTLRRSGRVVVVDEFGCVLLCRIDDPQDALPPVWVTPGGGAEPGEDPVAAAARELHEETGVVLDPSDLGDPVAVCRGEWTYRGTPLYSEDWFFAARTPRFAPSDGGLTDLEREIHDVWRWWRPDELRRAGEPVLPAGLAEVVERIAVGRTGPVPVELPWTEV